MFKVINFLTQTTISTHADEIAANAWIESKGYRNAFLGFCILKDPTESHKPTVLRIIKEDT